MIKSICGVASILASRATLDKTNFASYLITVVIFSFLWLKLMEVFYLSYFTKFECDIEDTYAFMKDYSKFG